MPYNFCFQPKVDRNVLFSCIRPQVCVDRKSPIYTSNHMRYHTHGFATRHRDKVEILVKDLLAERNVTFDQYLDKMYNMGTCGFETTLIIVSIMLGIDICIIRPDFVWVSEDVAPYKRPVVIVQSSNGKFYGTKVINPVYIGVVPHVNCPNFSMGDGEIIQQSTPRRKLPRSYKIVPAKFSDISPISCARKSVIDKRVVEHQNQIAAQSKNLDIPSDEGSTSTITHETRQLVKKFEEAEIPTSTSMSTTIDPDADKNKHEGDDDTCTSQYAQKNIISSTTINSDMSNIYDEGTAAESEEKGHATSSKQDDEESDGKNNDVNSYQTMCAQPRLKKKDSSSEENGTSSKQDDEQSDGKNNDVNSYRTMCAQPRVKVKHSTSEDNVSSSIEQKEETDGGIQDVNSYQTMCGRPTVKRNDSSCEEDINETSQSKPNLHATEGKTELNPDSNGVAAHSGKPKDSEPFPHENSDDKINIITFGKEDEVGNEGKSMQLTSKKRRLGMNGPAYQKKEPNVSLMDISQELKLGESDEVLQVRGNARQDTILKYGCQKCPEMFFTMEGHHRHLFDFHKI